MITKAELIKCMEEKIPVRLRNGVKAYIATSHSAIGKDYDIELIGDNKLIGIYKNPIGNKTAAAVWNVDGTFYGDKVETLWDIVGLWTEPRPTRIINGIEVPAPLSWAEFKPEPEPDGGMIVFFISHAGGIYKAKLYTTGRPAFETGSVYATEEDALANLIAYMKDIE